MSQISVSVEESADAYFSGDLNFDIRRSRHSGWRKSSWSLGDGECVEVNSATGQIFVRDTKNKNAGTLVFPAVQWDWFIRKYRVTL